MKYNSIKSVGEEKKKKKRNTGTLTNYLHNFEPAFCPFPESIMLQRRTICPTFSSKNHILTTKAVFTSARRGERSSCFSKRRTEMRKAWPSRTVKTTLPHLILIHWAAPKHAPRCTFFTRTYWMCVHSMGVFDHWLGFRNALLRHSFSACFQVKLLRNSSNDPLYNFLVQLCRWGGQRIPARKSTLG